MVDKQLNATQRSPTSRIRVLAIVCGVVGLVVAWACIFILPAYLASPHAVPNIAERLKLQNDIRTTLLQALGGLFLLIGAIATFRQMLLNQDQLRATREQMLHEQHLSREQLRIGQRQLKLSEESQITDLFTRAIDQLGSDKLDVRIGGIYALARIAKNSEADREPILEILTAYVKQHSPWPPRGSPQPPLNASLPELPSLRTRAADVFSAMTTLGGFLIKHTDLDHPPPRRRPGLSRIDLRKYPQDGAYFKGVWLAYSNLAGSWLNRVNVEDSDLRGVILTSARLAGANMKGANLAEAEMSNAHLMNATLERASLTGTNLTDAILQEANLRGANLMRASLQNADLKGTDLEGAKADFGTQWPEDFDWKAAGVIMASE